MRSFVTLLLVGAANSLSSSPQQLTSFSQDLATPDLLNFQPKNTLVQDGDHDKDVKHYLYHNGYWFKMCVSIHEAFDFCEVGRTDVPSEIKEFYPKYAVCRPEGQEGEAAATLAQTQNLWNWFSGALNIWGDEETETPVTYTEQQRCDQVNLQKLFKCQNQVLMYKAHSDSTQDIWNALDSNSELCQILIRQCQNIFLVIDEYGYFQCKNADMLKYALQQRAKPAWQSHDEYELYKIVPVKEWPLLEKEHEYSPELNSEEGKVDVEVNGKYSADLDLFFTAKEAEDLFDVHTNTYKDICKLAVEMLTVKSTDESKFTKLQEQLTNKSVFNYISEEKKVRTTLYYVCLFMNYNDYGEAQKLMKENKENFDKLFT